MEFNQKLRTLRKEKGMSQEEFADRLNVSRQAVSKWENGQGFPETEKLLQISQMFQVSLDYLLKEEDGEQAAGAGDNSFYCSREAAEGYLYEKRRGAKQIALGVAILIFSLGFQLFFGDGLGTVLFIVGAAVGIGVLVAQGFAPHRYEELEKKPLIFDQNYLKEFRETYQTARKRYGAMIIFAILLCIAGCAFSVIVEEMLLIKEDWGLAFFPALLAPAVYLFIFSGSCISASEIILYPEQHAKELQDERKFGWLWGLFMPLAAAAYLAIGFLWGAWHPGWLIFPVAAFICLGIIGWKNSKS